MNISDIVSRIDNIERKVDDITKYVRSSKESLQRTNSFNDPQPLLHNSNNNHNMNLPFPTNPEQPLLLKNINDLFRGDDVMYERSIKTINGFNDLEDAELWIKRELKLKLGWDESNEVVKQFDQLIKRRFS